MLSRPLMHIVPPPAATFPELSCDAAADVWHALLAGEVWIVGASSDDDRRTFVAVRRRVPAPVGVRERRVANALGRGLSRKEIAYELGISRSSVGRAIDDAARAIGVEAPLDLVLLSAAFGPARRPGRGAVERDGERLVLAVSLGACALWSRLSSAERQVVELAVAGLPARAIASRRGDRSERTIANQLAQVFRKVGVSGRAELAARLLTG